MFWGCVAEMIGYGGRIMMWQDPFSFPGFLIQISDVVYLGTKHSRFSPELYYWLFIPCDIVSLVLQSTGGALSSISSGDSTPGVNVGLAGLSFQVFSLTVFILLALDYAIRYTRGQRTQPGATKLPASFKVFIVFLSLAILLILIRCSFRIGELNEGYFGPLIHDQGLFIALEGVMIIAATFALNIAHPGPVFRRSETTTLEESKHIADAERLPVSNL
ncbi:Envelope glycoprotein gp160 [Coniosporium apollinis]|uniref:Envelope glycoprotein gp160 n=2 Tax=Coniosporium TaxID=2810619 RepID=A0ABQ9NFU8_9PEZI|nr:Envelope glycoprotein gp160 [Cladosporium sp. JES 115]KAJ9654682.1 Envelope glycoprotein gp160 [Coniosporium apollinis]